MSAEVRAELDFMPYAHQRAAHALRLVVRFLVLVWHRRAGKTVFAIVELILGALACTKPRGRYGYIAPFLKQAKTAAWDYLKHFARCIPNTVINEVELSVEFPNGAKVRLYGADNPDSLRGFYLDGAVLDEVADMRPEVWGEIIRPALTDRLGWAIFIGTPKGVNLFSELYQRALKEEGWAADLKRAPDTGVIPPAELEQAKREMSPAQYAQEMECDFSAAVDNVLLRLDDVLEAQRRLAPLEAYVGSGKAMGVDVARYGDDWNVVAPRQGICAKKPKRWRGLDTMASAAQVAMSIDKWQPDAVFVDQGGVGAGVIDRLRQLGYPVIGVDFGGKPTDPRFENRRAELWWNMADWVKSGGCLPDMSALAAELTAPTYTYANARGKLQLESKDDMRARGIASPDIGDALACTFYAPVAPKGLFPAAKNTRHVSSREHDPYRRDKAPEPRHREDF